MRRGNLINANIFKSVDLPTYLKNIHIYIVFINTKIIHCLNTSSIRIFNFINLTSPLFQSPFIPNFTPPPFIPHRPITNHRLHQHAIYIDHHIYPTAVYTNHPLHQIIIFTNHHLHHPAIKNHPLFTPHRHLHPTTVCTKQKSIFALL